MTETAKKKQISISSRLKKAPYTNEVLYHNSTLLLKKTSGFSDGKKWTEPEVNCIFEKKTKSKQTGIWH